MPEQAAHPTYHYTQSGLAPTSLTNIMAIESGASRTTRIVRLVIYPGNATAAGVAYLSLLRETTAGSTNAVTASNIYNRNPNDPLFSGIIRSNGLTPGTNTANGFFFPIPTPASSATSPASPIVIDLSNDNNAQGLVIPQGTNNGIVFTHSGLAGAAGFSLTAVWTEWVI